MNLLSTTTEKTHAEAINSSHDYCYDVVKIMEEKGLSELEARALAKKSIKSLKMKK